MGKPLDDAAVIELLRKRQGERTQAEFAQEIGISPAYLSDVYQRRRAPGPTVLEYLGLEKAYTQK